MKYALNLDDDGRVLSSCVVLPNGNYDGMPTVDELPEGNVSDYRYANGFIYDPLPKPEQPSPEPTADDILNALLGVNRYA